MRNLSKLTRFYQEFKASLTSIYDTTSENNFRNSCNCDYFLLQYSKKGNNEYQVAKF